MNTQHSNSGMPDLGTNLTGSGSGGAGISAAEVTAIVQAQLAYLQSTAGNATSSSPDSNQHVIAGLSSILDSIGQLGTEGLVISMIGKAALGAYDVYHARQENESAPGIEDANQRALDNRRMKQIEGWEGSGHSARLAAEAAKDKLVQIENEKRALDASSELDFTDLGSVYDHLTGATDRKLRENADAKSREQINLRRSEKAQAKHFAEEEGPMIEAQKKLNEGDTRAAETLQAKVMWMQEFKRLKDAGAPDDKTAGDGATERVKSHEKAQQDRHAQSYARLVSARDGATDTARVASAAHEDRLRHTPSISLEELRKDMNRNHTEATHAITRKNYSRK